MPLFDTTLRNTRAGEKPQKLSDGGGLYLLVKTSGKKFWHMAYRFDGKQKLLSFGQYPEVSLSDAREARQKARELLAKGIDPGQVKKEAKQAKKVEEQIACSTFQKVATEWLKIRAEAFRETRCQTQTLSRNEDIPLDWTKACCCADT